MNQIYDKSGALSASIGEYDIAAATAIKRGQVVKLSAGKVVLAAAGETGAILGYANENHSGNADVLDSRANGTKIRVEDSPGAVAESDAPRITATGGSATTITATGIAGFANDDFNGGYAKLVEKAAASAVIDPIGSVYAITDFVAADKTFTIDKSSAGAVTAGDVFEIYPPYGFAKGNFSSGIDALVLNATASLPIKSVGRDIKRGKIYTAASLHFYK